VIINNCYYLGPAVSKIPKDLVTKTEKNTESYYDFLISKYITPYFTLFFKRLGVKNPNFITLLSFLMIFISSVMLVNVRMLPYIFYRVILALLIQLNFIFDCTDGQFAKYTGTISKLGAWLDKILDRVGEFMIFSVCGYVAFQQSGNPFFLFLGITTGYCLTAYSMAMAISGSSKLHNFGAVGRIKKKEKSGKDQKKIKNRPAAQIIKRIFFFLNFGIGERYLYISFFILIFRLDIMLYISSFLAFLRMISISYKVGKNLKKTDTMIKELESHE